MMNKDDPVVLSILRRCMAARIATLSRNGRPSVNPLYFIPQDGMIWLGTVDWTLAARNVKADPRVSVLFELWQGPVNCQVLRMTGRASLRTDAGAQVWYGIRVAWKYLLTLGGMRNTLAHLRQSSLQRRYRAQNARKGRACLIEVTPEQVELFRWDDLQD